MADTPPPERDRDDEPDSTAFGPDGEDWQPRRRPIRTVITWLILLGFAFVVLAMILIVLFD